MLYSFNFFINWRHTHGTLFATSTQRSVSQADHELLGVIPITASSALTLPLAFYIRFNKTAMFWFEKRLVRRLTSDPPNNKFYSLQSSEQNIARNCIELSKKSISS